MLGFIRGVFNPFTFSPDGAVGLSRKIDCVWRDTFIKASIKLKLGESNTCKAPNAPRLQKVTSSRHQTRSLKKLQRWETSYSIE